MSQYEKLLKRIINNPKTVRFEELDKILISQGFSCRQSGKGSSHYFYKKGEICISIPYNKPYVLVVYVKKVIEIIMENEIGEGLS